MTTGYTPDLNYRLEGPEDAPVLVVSAAEDTAAAPMHGEVVRDATPGSRFEVVPAAHIANVEQPEKSTHLILDHLEAT